MSHLWSRDAEDRWKEDPLAGDFIRLGPGGPVPLRMHEWVDGVEGPLLRRADGAAGEERWALLAPPRCCARINGEPLPAGIRVLEDRDAISLGAGQTLFFSTEEVARIEPYRGEEEGACCIRCKLPLEPGQPVVRCPASDCGFVHHQSADHPCWTYADGCAACGHPTDMNAGLQWSPAEL